MALKYKRILLKISGEALGGEKGMGFDEPTMDAICGGVKKAHELGVQIGIVVGGGNFWRGRSSGKMERTLADKIGMLATVMNALAVSDKLEQLGVPTEVFTSITMPQVAPAFTRKDALRAMDEGKIAVFGGGTGNPFFSTDTATALRAVEVSADVMFKATMVDGVYDKDPHKYHCTTLNIIIQTYQLFYLSCRRSSCIRGQFHERNFTGNGKVTHQVGSKHECAVQYT